MVLIAGIDEVGRGAGAGPVVAAAVILPKNIILEGLKDSKLLNRNQREILCQKIKNVAIDISIGVSEVEVIDQINILEATFLAMNRAVQGMKVMPTKLLIDGNSFKNQTNIPYDTVVKGDQKVACISAASIVAKIYRDLYMEKLHFSFSVYDWDKNKGYLTASHREACQNFGICEHHRKSFKILKTSN